MDNASLAGTEAEGIVHEVVMLGSHGAKATTAESTYTPVRIAKSGNRLPRRFVKSARALDDEAFAELAATARVVLN